MIFRWMFFICFIATASAEEYFLDLALTDKNLSIYNYQPSVHTKAVEVDVNGIKRSFYVYVPDKEVEGKMPVLIALHGAGRTGLSMLDTWHQVAYENNFIVIAPDGIRERWSVNLNEMSFIDAAIDTVNNHIKIDAENVYLFGHSNGGKQAISQAVLYPRYFQKVAVHGATLPSTLDTGVKLIENDLRIGLFLGDSDSIFSVKSARKTVEWLSSLELESDLYILKDHTHWYYSDAYQINTTIWNYLRQ